MSALETTVRVLPQRQTLILAGEAIPQRNLSDASSRRPLTIVATPADETLLLIQDVNAPAGSALIPLTRVLQSPSNPADAYLRTQAMSFRGSRAPLVDLYA